MADHQIIHATFHRMDDGRLEWSGVLSGDRLDRVRVLKAMADSCMRAAVGRAGSVDVISGREARAYARKLAEADPALRIILGLDA